jgi:hypothetical protein
MKKLVAEDENLKLEVDQNVIYGTYKTEAINIEIAMKSVRLRLKSFPCHNQKVVIDARNVKKVSKEARDYLASEAGYARVAAAAMVVEHSIAAQIVNFWLKISKPVVPSKMFARESYAVDWIRSIECLSEGDSISEYSKEFFV